MERLELPALRLWQLSQQALSGMVAGLLKQPKRRLSKGELTMLQPEDDSKAVRKRNAELERENQQLKDLILLLRDLPGNRERPAATQVRKRRDEAATTTPSTTSATAPPLPTAPTPSDPVPAATKTSPKVPRVRPKGDREATARGTDQPS
jgi:hypothetical protein